MNFKHFFFSIQVKWLERYLDQETTRLLKKILQNVGIIIMQGINNLNALFAELSAEINVLKEKVRTILNPEIEKLKEQIRQINVAAIQKVNAIKEAVLNKKISALEVDRQRIHLTFNWNRLKWVSIASFALCIIDTCFNHPSLQILAPTLLGAIVLSIAIAIGLTTSAHVIGLKIRNAPSVFIKRLWFIGGHIGAGILFYVLGVLRQAYLGTHTLGSSPLLWMFLNLFFFAIAVILVSQNLPSKEEWLEYRKLKEINKEIKALEQEKNILGGTLSEAIRKVDKLKERLEMFRNYRDKLLASLDKEEKRIRASALAEFEIKGGVSHSPHSKKGKK